MTRIETIRLRLCAMTGAALQAWVEGDGATLRDETGAVFGDPTATPPLFGPDLPMFRDRMLEAPEEEGWWVWLVSRRQDARAVGVCGLGGPPGEEGVALLGYAVYPEFQGRGYATEAARGLVSWVFQRSEAACVRVTIPAWNLPSLAVAGKLGGRRIGTHLDPRHGDVVVFEVPGPA